MLELEAAEQIGRWGTRYYVHAVDGEIVTRDEAPTPTDDDRPHRPFPVKLPKSEQMMYDRMRAIWAEQDALAAQPLEQFTAQSWVTRTEDGA